MSTDQRFARFRQQLGLAWPLFAVYTPKGEWRGYAMRRAEGVRMNVLAHAMAYQEHFPQLDRPALVAYLLNLLRTLHELYAAGVMLGDYNLANFLCHPQSRAVTLIDCDSWQVQSGQQVYRCAVSAPDMLAPELQSQELGHIDRTPASEYFALAILIFKTLMLGRHPYDVVNGEGPVENIRKGYFPYGTGGGGIPKGPWFNIWSHLPYKLKQLAIRTFKDGAQNPAARAPLAEWGELLHVYRAEMNKGWHSPQIKPPNPKPKDYRGQSPNSAPQVG